MDSARTGLSRYTEPDRRRMDSKREQPDLAVTEGHSLDVMQIMEMIPHRHPFLMIDRMTDIHIGVSAVGIKNVTINEPFFQGHFPTQPVMPGVLIVEAMAQTAAVLVPGFASRSFRATAWNCTSRQFEAAGMSGSSAVPARSATR